MLDASTVNYCYPVTAILYNRETKTAIVKRTARKKDGPLKTGNKSNIRYLSQSSLSRLAFLVANTSTKFVSMLTLTYLSFPTTEQAKKQLNRVLQYLERKAGRKLRYLWFMEFQKKGRVHFHVLLDLTRSLELQTSLSLFWAKLIEPLNEEYVTSKGKKTTKWEAIQAVHNHKRTWEAIRKEDGAKRYALKYALKTRQKKVPDGVDLTGRFWGTDRETGKIDWDNFEGEPINEKELRIILQMDNHPTKDFDVLPKYLFNFDP